MPEGKGMVVEDEFGLAGRSRSEIDHERIGTPGPLHPFDLHQVAGDRGRIVEFLEIAHPPREFRIGHQAGSKRRAVVQILLDLRCVLLVGDNHPDSGDVDPVFQVLCGEHRGAGAEDRAKP